MGDPVPTVDGIWDDHANEYGVDFDVGYANVRYNARVQNKLGGEVKFVFDWGDGTQTTTGYISRYVYEPHVYSKGGTYKIKVRYEQYSSWSNPFTFPVIDHSDLDVHHLESDPVSFRSGDSIDIIAKVENIESIATSQTTKLQFYYEGEKIEEPKTVGILQPGEIPEVKLKDFKFPNTQTSRYFRAEVEYLNCEITDINNIGDGYFTPKPRTRSLMNLSLLDLIQHYSMLRLFLQRLGL